VWVRGFWIYGPSALMNLSVPYLGGSRSND
jgi:hypothetical protein